MAETKEKRRKIVTEKIEKLIKEGVSADDLVDTYNPELVHNIVEKHQRQSQIMDAIKADDVETVENIPEESDVKINFELVKSVVMLQTILNKFCFEPIYLTYALHYYCNNATENPHYIDLIKILLSNTSVNVNDQNTEGYTALMYACSPSDACLEVIRLLLAHPDIDPNVKNSAGDTVFHMIVGRVECYNLEAFRLILSHPKSDASITNHNGYTAFEYCDQKMVEVYLAWFRRKNCGFRGMFMLRRPDLPVLPKEIWREIYKRAAVMEAYEAENRNNLNRLSMEFCKVPETMVINLSLDQTYHMAMGLLSIGKSYSEQAMSFLQWRDTVRNVSAQMEKFKDDVTDIIDLTFIDQDGNEKSKTIQQIEKELAQQERFNPQKIFNK